MKINIIIFLVALFIFSVLLFPLACKKSHSFTEKELITIKADDVETTITKIAVCKKYGMNYVLVKSEKGKIVIYCKGKIK